MLDFRIDGGGFEDVGLFTVWKKDGRQRLVIDCRGSNMHFSEPDKTGLASGASFSAMELQEGEQLWTGAVDIADAFLQHGLADCSKTLLCSTTSACRRPRPQERRRPVRAEPSLGAPVLGGFANGLDARSRFLPEGAPNACAGKREPSRDS